MGWFFQDRYKATRLTDEASLLACAAYVDLNPIRAALCERLEESDFTSVQRRIEAEQERAQDESPAHSESQRTPAAKLRHRRDSFLSPVSIDELLDPVGPCASESKERCSRERFSGHVAGELLGTVGLDGAPDRLWQARQNALERPAAPAASGIGSGFVV